MTGEIENLLPRHRRLSYIHYKPNSDLLLDIADVLDLPIDENDLKGAEDDCLT